MLQQTWSSSNKGELVEMILQSLQISGVGPMGLSQKDETRRDNLSRPSTSKAGGLVALPFRSPPPSKELSPA